MTMTKKYINTLFRVIVVAVFLFASVLTASAGVDVYAEGAYTETDLVVYIYADITTDAVCSAGVKLTYDNTVVTLVSAEKNEEVWFMGEGEGGTNYPYKNPENSGDDVVVICGKLDTAAPTAGVIGARVLLGKVFFNRIDDLSPDPMTPVSSPEDGYFGVVLGLGRVAPYVNFATMPGGSDIDGTVTFSSVTIRERGDANGNGELTTQDMAALRYYIVNGGIGEIWKDCNGVDGINTQDMACIRYKLTH